MIGIGWFLLVSGVWYQVVKNNEYVSELFLRGFRELGIDEPAQHGAPPLYCGMLYGYRLRVLLLPYIGQHRQMHMQQYRYINREKYIPALYPP